MPIINMDEYVQEETEINVRGLHYNKTLEECDYCRNFTVRDAIDKIFDGSFEIYVITPFKPTAQDCKAYSMQFSIRYITWIRFPFYSIGDYCIFIYNPEEIKELYI